MLQEVEQQRVEVALLEPQVDAPGLPRREDYDQRGARPRLDHRRELDPVQRRRGMRGDYEIRHARRQRRQRGGCARCALDLHMGEEFIQPACDRCARLGLGIDHEDSHASEWHFPRIAQCAERPAALCALAHIMAIDSKGLLHRAAAAVVIVA